MSCHGNPTPFTTPIYIRCTSGTHDTFCMETNKSNLLLTCLDCNCPIAHWPSLFLKHALVWSLGMKAESVIASADVCGCVCVALQKLQSFTQDERHWRDLYGDRSQLTMLV